MEWKPIPKLIEEYRQQVTVIDQRIALAKRWEPGEPSENQNDIEKLYSMRASLIYSIRLMTKYIKGV